MTPLSTETLERFAGTYTTDVVGEIKISVEGDHLVFTNKRVGSVQLFPAKDRTFFSFGETPDLTLTVDDNGKVSGFSVANVMAKKL